MVNNIKETLVAAGLIVITVLLLNPFDFWMPDMMVMGALLVALVLFSLFAGFILREQTKDERDGFHRTLAGRNAFLAGAALLTLGIVTQGYRHSVDPFLVVTLTVMILVKLGTRIWSDRNL